MSVIHYHVKDCADVLADVNVGSVEIADEQEFKNRTQEEVNNLASAMVSGNTGEIIKAAQEVGITVTTDVDGNISAESMQQLADAIPGLESKTVALTITTSVTGGISEDMPSIEVENNEYNILDLLVLTSLAPSIFLTAFLILFSQPSHIIPLTLKTISCIYFHSFHKTFSTNNNRWCLWFYIY